MNLHPIPAVWHGGRTSPVQQKLHLLARGEDGGQVLGGGEGWQEGREEEEISRLVEGGQQAGTVTCIRERVEASRKVNRIHNIILFCFQIQSAVMF
jgi:hypothetical protein